MHCNVNGTCVNYWAKRIDILGETNGYDTSQSTLPSGISGIEIVGECEVQLYTETNYSGAAITLTESMCSICAFSPTIKIGSTSITLDGKQYLNDKIKSMKITQPLVELEDAVQILFFSDIEENYREHTTSHAERVIETLINVGKKNLKYDGEYSDVDVDPELWIHGGDMGNFWGGGLDNWMNDNIASLVDADANPMVMSYSRLWEEFYNKKKPFISVQGNHDWQMAGKDSPYSDKDEQRTNNYWTREFVEKTFEESSAVSDDFYFEQYSTDSSHMAQDYFKVKFKGLQIGMMGWQGLLPSQDENNEEYDEIEQWNDFVQAMNDDEPTVFVSHIPTSNMIHKSEVRDFLDKWSNKNLPATDAGEHKPAAIHLTGHTHAWGERNAVSSSSDIREYTVSYPYDNYHEGNKRGYYMILASPTHGILQVKPFEFTTDCWGPGTLCGIGTTCNNDCCYDGGVHYEYWYSKVMTACGKEPAWEDGSECALGTTCNACENEATWWDSKFFTACGSEPKWSDGSLCGLGTTCDNCKNSASYWYGKAMTACGDEPCWGRGTPCLPGTSCNACCKGDSWWSCD